MTTEDEEMADDDDSLISDFDWFENRETNSLSRS